jgi:hypothetical protein
MYCTGFTTADILSDVVQVAFHNSTRTVVRSSASSDYAIPLMRTKPKLGERAFSHAGPAALNSQPVDLRAEKANELFNITQLVSLLSTVLLFSCL